MRRARVRQIAAVGALSAGLALAATGCGVGERPTLASATAVGGETGTPTGNAAADAVLQRLEGNLAPSLTASYEITSKFRGTSTPATVARSGGRMSVTIGDVRFLADGSEQTCALSTGQCESGRQEARVSDTATTSTFFAASPARQLRVSLARESGTPTASTTMVAGQPALCVTVPVGDGKELTCATQDGLVATWDTGSVHVDLTHLVDTVDGRLFETKA